MKDKISLICAFAVLCWAIYKYIKVRNPRYPRIIAVFVAGMLTQYPFYLPIELTFFLWGVVASWTLLRKNWKQKRDPDLIFVSWILVGFTIIFLAEAAFKMGLLFGGL